MRRIYGCLAILVMLLLGAMCGSMVFATNTLSDEEMIEYSLNDIMFYQPCGEGSSGGVGLLEGKDNKERVWNWFVSAGIDGVSDNPEVIAGIMGNIGKESGYNPFAKNSSGYYGLYQEDSADMREYVEGKIGSVEWGSSTDDAEKNSAAIAAELEWLQDHSDFKQFVKDLDVPSDKDGSAGARAYAELFLVRYERAVGGDDAIEDSGVYDYMKKMYNGTTYEYQNARGRRDEAEEVYAYVQENSTGETVSSGDSESDPSCNSCAQGSLNINGAGACLAWPLGSSEKDYDQDLGGHPVPLMQEAWKKTGLYNHYKNDHDRWESDFCSGWVAAVVRWSGYDTKFSTANPGLFNRLNKDLWDVIPWDKKKESLQGGDVLYSEGHHTWMVIEDSSGELYIGEASLTYNQFGHIVKYGKGNTHYPNPYIVRAKNARNSNVGVNVEDENGVKTSSTTGTMINTGKGNHDIGVSAIELAWPAGTKKKVYVNEPYEKFKEFYVSLPNAVTSGVEAYGKSCDYFVRTVVVYAGLGDENSFPLYLSQMPEYFEKNSDWEEVTMKNPKKVDEYQSGDIIIFYKNAGGAPSHVGIFAEDSDGKHIVQASHADDPSLKGTEDYDPGYYGRVRDTGNITSDRFPYIRVFRNKNNKSGGMECDICDDGSSGSGQLKEGGYDNVEDAKWIIDEYHNTWKNDKPHFGDVCNVGKFSGSPHANCTNFSMWFAYHFMGCTDLARRGVDGKNVAGRIYDVCKKKFSNITKNNSPSVYSIASWDSPVGKMQSFNHTAVVVGIDKANDKIIFADAAWCNHDGRITEDRLSKYEGHGTYVDVSEYVTGLKK